MKKRLSSVSEQFNEFFGRVVCWLWDTLETFWDILLDFLARMLELVLVMLNLHFQVTCFLRDLCIEAMRTYLNVFRGILNIIRSIRCDDIEDFASACIVVVLWIEAVRIIMSLVKQNPATSMMNWFCRRPDEKNLNDLKENSVVRGQQRCPRRKSGKRNGRYAKRYRDDAAADLVD